jgi:prepilin-type N-terminal cleavage/methylation domain-containing protein
MNTKREKGFTLIELLVVISVISLVASIIISALGTARQKASNVAKIRTLAEVKNALNIYFNDFSGGNGTYPGTDELITKLTMGTTKYIANIDPNIEYVGLVSNHSCATACSSYQISIKGVENTNGNQNIIYSLGSIYDVNSSPASLTVGPMYRFNCNDQNICQSTRHYIYMIYGPGMQAKAYWIGYGAINYPFNTAGTYYIETNSNGNTYISNQFTVNP